MPIGTYEEWLNSEEPDQIIVSSLRLGLPRKVAVYLVAEVLSTLDVDESLELAFAWLIDVARRWSLGESVDNSELTAVSDSLSGSLYVGHVWASNFALSSSYTADAMTKETDSGFAKDMRIVFYGLGYSFGNSIADFVRSRIPFDNPHECKLILGRIVHPLNLMSQPEIVQATWDVSFGSF